MDNVASAIVNRSVTLVLVEDKPFDEEAVAIALKKQKIVVTETKKSDTHPF